MRGASEAVLSRPCCSVRSTSSATWRPAGTSKGRQSGRPRVAPLIYRRDGENYVIVASKGGADEPPAWYLNLVANPEVEIQVEDQRFVARARDAEGDERERLWAEMARIWPQYDDYQRKTERQIPVVVLEPQR